MKDEIEYFGMCYVLVQIDSGKIHPITHVRHNLVWYPERGMPLLHCIKYRPYVKSIVTECPWIISCYSQENVRVWERKLGWIQPKHQTYGASISHILMSVLGIKQTIPSMPLDSGRAIRELIKKLERRYSG